MRAVAKCYEVFPAARYFLLGPIEWRDPRRTSDFLIGDTDVSWFSQTWADRLRLADAIRNAFLMDRRRRNDLLKHQARDGIAMLDRGTIWPAA